MMMNKLVCSLFVVSVFVLEVEGSTLCRRHSLV